jgi:hypothetical protein
MSKLNQHELDDLTAWAESDAPTESGVIITGDKAAEMGQDILRRCGQTVTGQRKSIRRGTQPAPVDALAPETETRTQEIGPVRKNERWRSNE